MFTAKQCLPNSMSERPGYTSGRGATISDLDSKKLSFIYDRIRNNISKEASNNFIDMVQDLRVASCTGFLNALYSLEYSDWKYTKNSDRDVSDIHVENEGEGIGTILAKISGSNRDETLQIVGDFLRTFGKHHITLNDRIRGGRKGYYYRNNNLYFYNNKGN